VLSAVSYTASFATLAALKQGAAAYLKFRHVLLMPETVIKYDSDIYRTAGKAGVDVHRMEQDMMNGNIAVPNRALDLQISNDITVGQALGITAIPAFIINGYLVTGPQDYNSLKKMVAYVRSLKKGH
jgi:protein-disulfide isomerase